MNIGGLQRSSVAGQGMNCEKLCRLLKYIRSNPQKLQSLLILKNGHVVTELYSYPFHPGVVRYLNCCTASVISALVGIALEEGLIGGVEEKIAKYFPEYGFASDDPRKADITIEHLLQMSTGLKWDDTGVVFGEKSYDFKLNNSEEPVRFILEQPMTEEPGKRYNHCAGAPHLLSAIVQRVSGMGAGAYAEEKLFKPLEIAEYEWYCDKKGINAGMNGLSLTVESLAKIGQLFLQKGCWERGRIIPESWIIQSTRKRVDTNGTWSFYGGGYLWQISRFGGYFTKGVSGQYLAVVPNLNLVVAMIADLPIEELFWPDTLMETFILPAARIPGNSRDNLLYQEMLGALADELNRAPKAKTVPPLPATASKISGKEFVFAQKDGFESVVLDFASKDQCLLKVREKEYLFEASVGLDDVYRISKRSALKGCWKDTKTFIVTEWQLGYNYVKEFIFTFDGDKMSYTVSSPAQEECCKAEGGRTV